ncbi:MAG: hypothetical protein AB1598_09410 [Thermodesulfobacteriota bacterium]
MARALFFVFLILCASLVFLNFYLNGKLKQLAPAYLKQFSNLSGFDLYADEAGLDPLFRIRLNGVRVSDQSLPQKVLAEIQALTIDPGIMSSLLSGSITVREIVIDGPVIRYDVASAGKIRGLIERGGDGSKGTSVGIEKIRLNGARFEISPQVVFTSGALKILIDKSRGESRVDIDGDVAVFGNGMDVSGTVNVKPGETSGQVKLVTDKSRPGSAPESFVSSHNLKGVAEITFKAADTIDSHGRISILSGDAVSASSDGKIAALEYGLVYDRSVDTAHISKLSFDILNIICGALGGDVKDVTGGLAIDLEGSASSGDMKQLSKWFPDINAETLAGNIRSDNLSIGGSVGKNDIALTGKFVLDGIGFTYTDESLRVSGLGCEMEVIQHISGKAGFSFTSRGPCSAEEFSEKDAGIIKSLTAGVDIKSAGFWNSIEVSFSNLDGQYMDGTVSGSLNISSRDGKSEIKGNLKGAGLNLERAPKSITPFDLAGTAESVSADIEGNPGMYKAGITFAVNDFTVRSKTGREFKVSKAVSSVPLALEYSESEQDGEAGISPGEKARKIIIRDKGLSYENLSFGEYFIEGGKVDELTFSLALGGDWTLGMASRGRGFQVLGIDVHLGEFKEHIDIGVSGRRGFSGTIDGTGGRFKSVDFPALSAEYVFNGNSIDVRKLSARVSTIGELRSDNLRVEFGGEEGGYPYKVILKDGTFSGYGNKLTSEGIAGSFTVNNPKAGTTFWEGTAAAAKSNIFSQVVEGLKLNITPSPDGIILKDIAGKFMNGDLRGSIDIITSGAAARIAADLGLVNASVKSGGLDIALGRGGFDFSGTLPDNSLPEGTGRFGFDNLNIKREGLDVAYSGGANTRTGGETLFIEDGFIRNKDKSELRFSGEMENALGSERKLGINFQDFPLTSAIKFLSPFIPLTVREDRIAGTVGFSVEFYRPFDTGGGWNGSLSFKGASLAAFMGGADLSLRGINGTITVKDEGEAKNALASLLDGELKLDRALYKKYHQTFRESDPDAGADHIKIDEIEYGILKFENVECALEADGNKVGIIKLSSGFFGGSLYASGALEFDKPGGSYNFSFLFNDISLGAISKRLSPSQEYITGRVNGLVWLTGEGAELGTIDGPFEFWSVSSAKEPRSIGKALLDQLGAKERLILGSSRSYDNGEISGYISDGVITFRKFNISNSILGIKNLSIQADPVKNSISIAHLVSVIREIARRSQSGGPTIETQ